MANAMRGEARIVLDGEAHVMRLTLGALAELEETLGAECLADLVARFEGGGVTARDLVRLIGAGLRGALLLSAVCNVLRAAPSGAASGPSSRPDQPERRGRWAVGGRMPGGEGHRARS